MHAPARPTMADVASAAGVGTGTVSRVLNNNSNFSTSDGVRQKIRKILIHLANCHRVLFAVKTELSFLRLGKRLSFSDLPDHAF